MTTTDSRILPTDRLKTPALVIVGLGFVCGVIRLATLYPFFGYDFDVYRIAGRAVLRHESLFGPWMGQHLSVPLPFTYPPFAAVLSVPFSLIGANLGYVIWNAISIVVLFFVVRATTGTLVDRLDRQVLALGVLFAIAIALAPVQEEIRYGQVGIVLMAMCLFDCLPQPTRLPRGVLVGAATAIKLVPGIFIPYLWFTGRKRAAAVAVSTFLALSCAAAAITPADSKSFWTSRVFDNSRVGNLGYVSNQSVNGLLVRAVGSHDHTLWLLLAAVVVIVGIRYAASASKRGQESLGIALVALVGVLVSPVSWIHHLVWVVPVLAVVVADGTDRRRVAIAATAGALFTLRLPYLADSIPTGWHLAWIAAVVRDGDGLVCIALFALLVRLSSAPGATADAGLRSGPTPSTARIPRPARRQLLRALRTHAPHR